MVSIDRKSCTLHDIRCVIIYVAIFVTKTYAAHHVARYGGYAVSAIKENQFLERVYVSLRSIMSMKKALVMSETGIGDLLNTY